MIEIKIENAQGSRTLVIVGEVDLDSSPQLWSAMEESLAHGQRVEVDMQQVSYIDSSGIATLIKGFRHAQKTQVEFVIRDPSASVLAVIQLARLDGLFSIVSSS